MTKKSVTSSATASMPLPSTAPTITDIAASPIAAPSVPTWVCRTQARFLVSSAAMMISVAAYDAEDTAATTCAAMGSSLTPVLLSTPPANGASVPKSARIASARSHVYTKSTAVGRRSCSSSRDVIEFGTPAMMPSRPAPAACTLSR